MKNMQLAGNRVLSHTMSSDELLQFKLRVHGYEKFNELLESSRSDSISYFRTPLDVNTPQPGPGYQYDPNDDSIRKAFSDYVCNVINDFFGATLVVKDLWYLYQTNDQWINNPVHLHMTAEWIAVMYLDVNEGDTIQFFDAANNMEEYAPSFGEVLFFPATALHKPGPNAGNKRLTLNAELGRAELSPEEVESIRTRMSVCKGCDKFNATTQKCSECSCYIPMKIANLASSCPIGKW